VKPVQIEEEDMLDLGLGRSIYNKVQVEEFLKFQDSQETRRAYLRETAELSYGGRGEDGSWGKGGPHQRSGLVPGASLPPDWTHRYFFSAWTLCVEHGISDYFSDCTCMHHLRSQRRGLWLLGAFWSLPFQLIINPVRWANEAASEVADRVAMDMESQAHMDEEKRRMSCDLSSLLHKMREGHSLYPPYMPRLGTEAEETF
jgi:hypothetical protein